jgi:hypothetical protein
MALREKYPMFHLVAMARPHRHIGTIDLERLLGTLDQRPECMVNPNERQSDMHKWKNVAISDFVDEY